MASYSPRPNRTGRTMAAFTNPFATRQQRSASSSSNSSFTSASSTFSNYATPMNGNFSSSYSNWTPGASLNEILALSSSQTRNASLTSLSSCPSRRPSCFSILEVEEEKAEFGEACVSVLEPRRDMIGYWGLGQVLEEDSQ